MAIQHGYLNTVSMTPWVTPWRDLSTVCTLSTLLDSNVGPESYQNYKSILTSTDDTILDSWQVGPSRPPIDTHHPAVRTHPVTGLKALNVNNGFVAAFAELKKDESDKLLDFFKLHIHSADDHYVRWKWAVGSVAIWDNVSLLAKPIIFKDINMKIRGVLLIESFPETMTNLEEVFARRSLVKNVWNDLLIPDIKFWLTILSIFWPRERESRTESCETGEGCDQWPH